MNKIQFDCLFGVKKQAVFCAVVVMLSIFLLFTFCSDSGTNPNDKNYYTLDVGIDPAIGGTVSRDPETASYAAGTNVTVTATAQEGYEFTGWTGALNSANAKVTVTINTNTTLTANFHKVNGGEDDSLEHNHTWGDWIVTTPATCDAPGEETRKCTKDTTHTETKEIEQLTGSECGNDFTYTGRTVKIGNLTWMAENLNRNTSGSSCYNNHPDSCAKYGRLYTWNAAMTACPANWRLPNNDDWNNLIQAADGGSIAGRKLKSASGWYNGDNFYVPGTDDLGFSALPGGSGHGGSFELVGRGGYWWSATENNADMAWFRSMGYSASNVVSAWNLKTVLSSVRCVQGDIDIHTWGNWIVTKPATCDAPGEETRTSTQDASHTEIREIAQLSGIQCDSHINYGSFTDTRAGANNQSYRTVVIGGKTWFAENLNFAGSSGDIGVCYLNSPDSCAKYGRLYRWHEAMDISSTYETTLWGGIDVNHQGVCPAGWRLPNNNDWDDLMIAVGGVRENYGSYGWWNGASTKLKSRTWDTCSGCIPGTDEFGFSALPGGLRDLGGGFNGSTGTFGGWWSATEDGASYAWDWSMNHVNDDVGFQSYPKTGQFSARCVRD